MVEVKDYEEVKKFMLNWFNKISVNNDTIVHEINRLYKLPLNLNTTLRFLESVCAQQDAQIPVVRQMLKIN